MLGETIRQFGFWTLDFLRGGRIRKHYRHIQDIIKTESGDDDALMALLKHAINTVPAYSDIAVPDLKLFPVVSKKDYKANYDSYRSSLHLNDKQLHKVYTSGSTGTPFMAYQDTDKIKWHQAGLINLNKSIGWQLGARFIFMRVWGVAHNGGKLSQYLSNTVPVNVIDYSKEKLEATRQTILNDKTLHLILGYASALEKLADYILACGNTPDELGIKLVIADSESLSAVARTKIEKAFGCHVLDRYANNENGIIAITHESDNRFFVNYPEYYVEILKLNNDEPAEEGETGRIVLTDLYNYAFPFIRYDTGDLGISAKTIDGQCFVISMLQGRISASLTDTKGNLLGETAVISNFEDLYDIGRYQIIQISEREYRFLLEESSNADCNTILKRSYDCFGVDAHVEIVKVERIEQGKNGKYPITINKIK